MHKRLLYAAGALAASLVWSGTALAVPGEATGDVNMRTGPGTQYQRIATIPAGAPVEVLGCPSWCQVVYAGRQGWVSSNYVAAASSRGYAPPVYAYEPAPRYAYRSAPPVVYFDYDRPRWRDRYYGRHHDDWWYNRRGWDRRGGFSSGIYFDF